MEIYQDFKELADVLNAHSVEYLIVGAHALARLGVIRNTSDIDIMTSITGVTWDEAVVGRSAGKLGDTETCFLGRDQFVANERATGRPKDIADLDSIGESDCDS